MFGGERQRQGGRQSARRGPALAAFGLLAAALAGLWIAAANPATAGLLLVVVVLLAATWGGLPVGIATAVLAAAGFNFFFIPPTGTFHVAAPSDWAALVAFLVTAALASRLVVSARREAAEAGAREAEVKALYALSVELFGTESGEEDLARAAANALRATGAARGGLVFFAEGAEGGETRLPGWIGESPAGEVAQRLASTRVHLQALEFATPGGRDLYLPLLLHGAPVGVLVALGTPAARGALESVVRLLGLALERSALLRDRAHMEALRESEALKTALLRAVSHDLSTPLTAMSLQVDGLRRGLDGQPIPLARLDTLGEQLARLQRRVGNLLSLARLETGGVAPHPEPTPAPDLFRAARESLPVAPPGREVKVEVAPDCPDLLVDPSLALEIVVNLLENAHRAAPRGTPIDLTAGRHPGEAGRVRLGVLDRGPGLPLLAGAGGEVDAGDVLPRGLGLEIARSFAAASGGAVRLSGRPGGGTCAWVDLPAAAEGEG